MLEVVRIAVNEVAATGVPTPAPPTPAPTAWPTDAKLVVKFTSTVTGYAKADFGKKSEVRKAYVATMAALAGVATDTVKIFRVADGATAAAQRRRLVQHSAVKQVSFDVEIKVADADMGTTLAAKVTLLTDAQILARFKAQLVALGEVVPAGLAVTKTAPVVAEATSKSNVGAIVGGVIGALIAAALAYYFLVHKKKKPATEKNVQEAKMTPVSTQAVSVAGNASGNQSTV